MTSHKTAADWHSLITEYHKSKKSITAFCQSKAISFHAFYHQLRASRGDTKTSRSGIAKVSHGITRSADSAFIEISNSKAPIVLRLRNNLSLEIPSDFNEREVRRLISVLESCWVFLHQREYLSVVQLLICAVHLISSQALRSKYWNRIQFLDISLYS